MCGHLLGAGYSVTVTTRSRERADSVLAAGAVWAGSPAEVAANSDVVFAMVGFPADVREVFLGAEGALSSAAPGTVLVDMSTSQPSLAVEIAQAAQAKGVYSLDAPVSGGDVGARNAALSIMVGGAAEAFEAVRPCFDVLGPTVVLQGGPGAGQHTKMVNQILIAGTMVSIAEALVYTYRLGLDIDSVLASVSGGAAGSWSLTNYVPRVLAGNFDPGFFVEHFVKDLGIALQEARQAGIVLPGTELAERLYAALQEQGRGRNGTQAIVHALAAVSNQPWPPEPIGR